MTAPFIALLGGLAGIPIFIIIALILGIRRLVIAARDKKKNSQTYTPPPPHQQGYQQQPNYQQQSYQQPTFTPPPQPGGQQPFGQQQPGVRRSTPIPSQYATYMPEAPKKKRNTTLIVVLVVAILAILAGAAIPTLTYMHDHNESGLTTSNFTLAYENPTDKEFVIILDDWDTIKVAPYSASENLEYTIRRDQQTLHWKMLDASGKTIADTTVEKDAITSWFYDNGWADKYDEGKILLNPSRSQFVTYTVWLLEDGKDYAQDVVIGDSTYSVDAIVTTSAFIFDVRTPDEITSLDGSNPYGSLERNQYLVSARDFMVLYKNLSGNDGPIAKFRAYKDHLDELVALSRAELLSSSNTSYQDEQKVDELDNLIPYVTASTVPRDFVPAIDYVRAHTSFFSDLNYKQYKIVDDSADTVLKNAYGVKPRPESFPALHYLSFSVERNGLMGDEAHRKIDYELDRDEEGGGIY